MALNIQQRGAKFQLRVADKLLPKPFFATFDTWADAHAYGTRMQATLAAGLVPQELLAPSAKAQGARTLEALIDEYKEHNTAISQTDRDLAKWVKPLIVGRHTGDLDFALANTLVREMKLKRRHKPGTIRQRIDFMGRVTAFYIARHSPGMANPFRMLPDGYSLYNADERSAIEARGDEVPEDEKRERRIDPNEDALIRRALAGEKMPGRERPIPYSAELEFMYHLIVNTGIRLREAYTLAKDAVSTTPKGTLFLQVAGTKGHRGAKKPRQVPATPALKVQLLAWVQQLPRGEARMFPTLWDGSRASDDLKSTTADLSQAFSRIFAAAGVEDLTEHDLRHEATCRYVLLRRKDGAWLLSPRDVQSIMGWRSIAMYDRYASLRGSDVVDVMAELDEHAPGLRRVA